MSNTQRKYGRRFDEEFKREVAALACRPGARQEQIARDLGVSRQADITYVATKEGRLYVAGVIDACSRRIVGWAAADTMPTSLVARAFERAVRGGKPTSGLLHHSDRGSQYASDAYRALLRRHGVVPSMSRPANCYDNAKMESF